VVNNSTLTDGILIIEKEAKHLRTRRIGRIFGTCPKCGEKDSMSVDTSRLNEVLCIKCEKWFDLCDILLSRGEGDDLLFPSIMDILIDREIALIFPIKKDIPFSSIISKYMTGAMKAIFNAEVIDEKEATYSPDGPIWITRSRHLMGFRKPCTAEPVHIAILHNYDMRPLVKIDERYKLLFAWLENFMRLMFIDELRYKEASVQRGLIFKLSESNPMHGPLSRFIIYCALLASLDDDRAKVFEILDSVKDDVDPRDMMMGDDRELSGPEISKMIKRIT